jgi:hypothetical protein
MTGKLSFLPAVPTASVADPGCLSRIRIFSNPDPGSRVKNIPDPGSTSKNLSILTQKIVSKHAEI